EERFVIVHPVKGSGAEDAVGNRAQVERGHIGLKDLYAIAEARREKFTSAANHVFRQVAGQNAAAGEALGQLGGQPAGAAAGVENGFLALQLDAVEDFEAPTELRVRDGVVGGGVPLLPLVGEHSSMMPEGRGSEQPGASDGVPSEPHGRGKLF